MSCRRFIVLAVACVLLTGCPHPADPPSMSRAQMLARSDELIADGRKMKEEGRALKAKGKADEGDDMMDRGDQKVLEGQQMKDRALMMK